MQYTVGEMAKRLHVAPSTLRYYDKEGLLPFLERSSGGIRIFQDSDFEWLSTAQKAGTCAIHETLTEADIPPALQDACRCIKGAAD